MKAYAYNAALYCEHCAELIKDDAACAGFEDSGDSNDYPQGPLSDGGGEADCPQHCDDCGTFLENPLTADGVQYVQEVVNERRGCCWEEWSKFYGISPKTEDESDEEEAQAQ